MFGNAIGNSIVDRMQPAPVLEEVHPTAKRIGGYDDELQEVQITPQYIVDEVEVTARRLDSNPTLVDPSLSLTPDQQRSRSANQANAVPVELQEELAREEFERAGSGPQWWRDENGILNIVITKGANSVPSVSASTNASTLGITDEAVDAAIAAGKTSAWDAAGYAARVTGYEVWNFLTAGFVKRHDARLIAEANGQLSTANFWKATALDAGGSVASVYLGGRVGGYVFGRLGTGYAAYIGSGAAGGAAFDLVQQGTQLGINAVTGGQTGQEQFSLNELALTTTSGALLGGAFKLGSGYNVRSPIYFDLEPAAAYSGVPLALRNPLVANSNEVSLSLINQSSRATQAEGVNYFREAALRSQMARSPAGQRVLVAADAGEIDLVFSTQGAPAGLYGRSYGNQAVVYLRNTQNGRSYDLVDVKASGYEVSAGTGIHEGLHALGVAGSRRVEALVRLAELENLGVPVSRTAMRQVLTDMQGNYSNYPWRAGRSTPNFPGLEF